MRVIFLHFVIRIGLTAVAVAILYFADVVEASSSAGVFSAASAVIGVGALALSEVSLSRFIRTARSNLVGEYLKLMFSRIAFAASAVLTGFTGYAATGEITAFLIGVVFFVAVLARAAPTTSAIQRISERMQGRGQALMTALFEPTDGGTRPT